MNIHGCSAISYAVVQVYHDSFTSLTKRKRLFNKQAQGFSWIELQLWTCVVQSVTSSSPSLLMTFYHYHLPCTIWVRSLILSISLLHRHWPRRWAEWGKKASHLFENKKLRNCLGINMNTFDRTNSKKTHRVRCMILEMTCPPYCEMTWSRNTLLSIKLSPS